MLTPFELNSVIKTLQIARDIVISTDSASTLTTWDIHDTLSMLQKIKATQEAKKTADNILIKASSFKADYVFDQLEKWKEVKKYAELINDECNICIAQCYINAYKRVLKIHRPQPSPLEKELAA